MRSLGGSLNDTQLTPAQQRLVEQILQDAASHGLTQAQVQNQIDRVLESRSRVA